MKTRIRQFGRFGTSAAVVALASVGVAQTTGGADDRPVVTARIVSELEFNDNYDLRSPSAGNALIWTTTFGAGLTSVTPTDEVFGDVQGSVRLSDLPEIGDDARLDDPRVVFSWDRQVDDNALEFDLNYRYVSIAFFDPLRDINPDGSFDDTRGDGDRETLRFDFDGEINADGPVSFAFDTSYDRRRYYDNTDPSLYDRDLGFVGGEFGFDLNRQVRATAGASYIYRDQDDFRQTKIETRRVDVGLDMDINQRMAASVRLGYSVVDTQRLPQFPNQGIEEGWVGGIDVITDMQNGEARFNFDTTIDENGPRSTATIGRQYEFPNSVFDADIGASVSENTDVRPVGFITYTHFLPRGEFEFNAAQTTTTDDDSRDVVNSTLGLSYLHNISRISSLDFTLLTALKRYETVELPDSDRVTFVAQYNRSLTRDWGMNFGYRYRIRDDTTRQRAQSNAVFFNIRRDFAALR